LTLGLRRQNIIAAGACAEAIDLMADRKQKMIIQEYFRKINTPPRTCLQ
jgi:hypothetical protein